MAKAKSDSSHGKSANGSSSKQTQDQKKPSTLREAIQALGGSAEDFDLVGGDNSDFEDAPDTSAASTSNSKGGKGDGKKKGKADTSGNLEKDLKNLVSELNFKDLDRQEESDGSEEASSSASEKEEEESEEEDEPEPEPIASRPKTEAKSATADEQSATTKGQQAAEPSASKVRLDAMASKMKPPSGPWLVKPHPVWHDIRLPVLPAAPDSYNLHPNRIEQLQERGDQLLTELNQQYSASLSPDSKAKGGSSHAVDYSTLSKADKSFIVTILKSGTSSDKLSALTLLASSSPLHCTSFLSQLLGLAHKKSRQEATKAVQSIVDWLKHQGLPSDRKLVWFADQPRLKDVAYLQQPKGKAPKDQKWKVGDEHLVVWAFESWLKKWLLDVLRAIEVLASDTLPFVKTQMTGHFFELLSTKPEQEHNLLRLLVNKLGDLHRPLASKTSYFLLTLLQENPLMKPIVIREVASLVLRPVTANQPKSRAHQDHSSYYGIVTLNQILLSRSEPEVATKLIDVYFEIFNDLLARIDAAHVAAEKAPGGKKKHVKKEQSREALELKAEQEEEGDSKMLAAVLTGVNRAFPYAAMDREVINSRLGTLFHIARTSTFNVSIQSLLLIAQLSETEEGLPDRFYRALYEAFLDQRLASSSKQPLFLNLVFRAMKVDRSPGRTAAFVKRIVQTLSFHQVSYVIGALHLLGKVFTQVPSLYSMVPLEQPAKPAAAARTEREDSTELQLNASAEQVAEPQAEPSMDVQATAYDPKASDPSRAGAEGSYLWELTPLLHHFHPSVAFHARQLVTRSEVSANQDLDHYTLSHFLDLFIYRDPKKAGLMRGASAMQPAAPGHDKTDRVALRKGAGVDKSEAVNAERFWKMQEEEVPPEQLFFHRFFNLKDEDGTLRQAKAESRKRRRGRDSDSDVDIEDTGAGGENELLSDFDSDEEEEIWRVMRSTLPRHEGNEDADADDIDEDISLDLSQDEAESGDEAGASQDSDAEDQEDQPFVSAFPPEEDEKRSEQDDEESDGELNFSEDSLIGSDEEMDIRLGETDEEQEEDDADAARKKSNKEKSNKRRKLKHLPTFATAEDYAALLGGDSDEDGQ